MQVYINEMLNLHRGQGLDIYWRDHTQCPSEEEYLEMVNHKTGGLFRLAVGLLQSFSECQLNFDALLKKIALYFQIRDDYINLIDIEYMEHKSFCEDLTEGKFSFPIIFAIQHQQSEDDRLIKILKQRTKNIELKKYAILYMKECVRSSY
jgi:geranylgeranyl diphosphate synthase type 3